LLAVQAASAAGMAQGSTVAAGGLAAGEGGVSEDVVVVGGGQGRLTASDFYLRARHSSTAGCACSDCFHYCSLLCAGTSCAPHHGEHDTVLRAHVYDPPLGEGEVWPQELLLWMHVGRCVRRRPWCTWWDARAVCGV
jgi:hypothetical protein